MRVGFALNFIWLYIIPSLTHQNQRSVNITRHRIETLRIDWSDAEYIPTVRVGTDDSFVRVERSAGPKQWCNENDEIMELLFPAPFGSRDLHDYNPHKVPASIDGGPLQIDVAIWVQDITEISDITSDFKVDIYLTELWLDPGLSFSQFSPCKRNLSMNAEVLESLWTPNACFINSKTARIHRSPHRNIFVLIYPNGTVWTNFRLQLIGPCVMDLTMFPFDSVECSLTFESFNYNTEEVKMRWKRIKPILILRKQLELADYRLIMVHAYRDEVMYPAGLWDELTMGFIFRRLYGWYILQAYLPTYLTIFISWISFVLGATAIPARTMLGVNSLLAMTFQFGNIIRNLPRVSYVKAIDVWMLSCMTFVFCSLLELAWVGYLTRDEDDKTKPNQKRCNHKVDLRTLLKAVFWPRTSVPVKKQRMHPKRIEAVNYDTNGGRGTNSETLPKTTVAIKATKKGGLAYSVSSQSSKPGITVRGLNSIHNISSDKVKEAKFKFATRIDKLSAFTFPTLFALFNVFYWYYYLT